MGIRQQLQHKRTRSSVQEHVKIQSNPTSASNLKATVFYSFALKKKSCLTTIFYGLLINSLTLGGSITPQYRTTEQNHRPV